MTNRLAVFVTIAVLSVATLGVYSFQRNADRVAAADDALIESVTRERTRQGLRDCLNNQEKAYSMTWDSNCESLGRPAGCPLPAKVADNVERLNKERREVCFGIWK